MISKKAQEDRITTVLIAVVTVLIVAAFNISATKVNMAMDPPGKSSVIEDSSVPLSASLGYESFPGEQVLQNRNYPIDKSQRNGVPVPYVPERYNDAPWEATFPALDQQYEEALALGYRIYNEKQTMVIFNGINSRRIQDGLGPLSLVTSGNLYELTYIRAAEIMDKYSHERPDGTTVVNSMSDMYVYAEILNGKSTPYRALQSWFGSPEHLEAILLPDIDELSIVGIEVNESEGISKQAVLFGNRDCNY